MHSTQDTADLVVIDNLSLYIGDLFLVKDVNISISSNQVTCLIGESGAGKSIIANTIMGLQNKDISVSGNIYLKNNDLTEKYTPWKKVRGGMIGMVFQDPQSSLNPCQKIHYQLGEMIQIHQNRWPSDKEMSNLLKDVELDASFLHRYPHQLSGGQRQRIMIAIALANHPSLLIADESTTALDVTTQRQILDLIKRLSISHNIAVLLITHNLNVVRYIGDFVYVLKNGQIIESNPVKTLLESPQEKYTQKLISAYNLPRLEINHKAGTPLLKVKDLEVYEPVNGVSIFTKHQQPIVQKITFTLNKGDNLGIIGESGAGKTTIAKALLELYPKSGVIDNFCKGKRSIQYVFQDSHAALNPRYTVKKTLYEARDLCQQTGPLDIEKIFLDVGLESAILSKYPHELSGGQKQRVNLARALLTHAEILILDEPTSALDAATQLETLRLLKKIKQAYDITYIIITHDIQIVRCMCRDVLVLKSGNIIDIGTYDEVFSNPHDYTALLYSASLLSK